MAMGRETASDPGAKHSPSPATLERHTGENDDVALAPLMPRVYIISETLLFREGLKAMLTRKGGLDVVSHGPSADAPEEIRHLAPELVLLDMAGPDSLVIPRRLRVILPTLRIVAVALAEQEADVIACAEAGICAY